jgi:uridine phosphorylase
MIQIHGGFQKTSRRLQQMNLVDTYRAEMTKEANNTLVSKIKQLKAHYGITVSEAEYWGNYRPKTMRMENLSLHHSRGRVT